MRFYGVVELPDSRFCADERLQVVAFDSRRDRDEWVARGDADAPCYRYLTTHGERRRAVTRDEALGAAREIMPGADTTLFRVIETEAPDRDAREA